MHLPTIFKILKEKKYMYILHFYEQLSIQLSFICHLAYSSIIYHEKHKYPKFETVDGFFIHLKILHLDVHPF